MSGYRGNIIIKNPATPTGPFENGSAPGVWTLTEAAAFKKQGIWPTQGVKANDPYFPYVTMLLSTTSLGNANNNLFVDSSSAFNPISRNGNTTQGAMTPYGLNWSNYFDGVDDNLTFPSSSQFAIATSTTAFTIEMWIYPTAAGSCIFTDAYTGAGNNIPICISMSSGSNVESITGQTIAIGYYTGASWVTAAMANTQVSLNTWTHIACVFTGSTTKIYYNGADVTKTSSPTPATSWGVTGTNGDGWYLARRWDNAGNNFFAGYISNFRFVNGTAVYTSAFTPSTSPLTAISNTALLTCQSNRFRDVSANNFTATVSGNPRTTDYSPFSPGLPGITYNQSDIQYWSGYFDGTGDYLQLASATALDLASGDFTVEFWGYPTVKTNVVDAAFGYGSFTLMCYHNGTNWTAEGSNNGSSLQFQISTPVTIGAWQHIAITRSGNTITLFKDGVSAATGTLTGAINTSGKTLRVGDNGNSQFFTGSVSNFRIVKGTAVYTGNFTPSTTPLTAIANTSLLTLQSAAFTDNSTNSFPITINGNTTVTGNNPFQTGYYSNYFDGSGDYLSIPSSTALTFGTGDFTEEAWVYMTTSSNDEITLFGIDTTTAPLFGVYQQKLYLGSRGTAYDVTASVNIPLFQWVHVAVTRQSGTVTLWQNGVSVGSGTVTRNYPAGTAFVGTYTSSGAPFYQGYVSNLRIVKGSAIYTASFTPPTAPLTAISGTSLLTSQSARFIDNSTNNATITVAGNTSIQSFDPFYTTTIASNGGSMYFDGSGDYLNAGSNQNFAFGTGAFTVECWFYATTTSTAQSLLSTDATNGFFLAFDGTLNFGIRNVAAILTFSPSNYVNAWNHVAVSRSGSTISMFFNGTRVATTSNSTNFSLTGPMMVGGLPALSGYYWAGYIANARITNGTAIYSPSSTTITVPTAPLTPSGNTTLLINGMNAGIYDATGINDLETVGDSKVSTAVSKFGGSSVAFDGSGDYLVIPSNNEITLGSGDFTIEFWIYLNSNSIVQIFYDQRNGNGAYPVIYMPNASIRYYVNTADQIIGSNLNTATWYHIAICRSGTSTRMFINGTQSGSTYTDTTNYLAAPLFIGSDKGPGNFMNGYMDDLRITKGVARYTSNFTPPTQAFQTY